LQKITTIAPFVKFMSKVLSVHYLPDTVYIYKC